MCVHVFVRACCVRARAVFVCVPACAFRRPAVMCARVCKALVAAIMHCDFVTRLDRELLHSVTVLYILVALPDWAQAQKSCSYRFSDKRLGSARDGVVFAHVLQVDRRCYAYERNLWSFNLSETNMASDFQDADEYYSRIDLLHTLSSGHHTRNCTLTIGAHGFKAQ